MATAYRKIENSEMNTPKYCIDDFYNNLTFTGLIAFHDPIRNEVKEAIKICQSAGMRPIIVTGDHKMTARAIALGLGLPAEERKLLLKNSNLKL